MSPRPPLSPRRCHSSVHAAGLNVKLPTILGHRAGPLRCGQRRSVLKPAACCWSVRFTQRSGPDPRTHPYTGHTKANQQRHLCLQTTASLVRVRTVGQCLCAYGIQTLPLRSLIRPASHLTGRDERGRRGKGEWGCSCSWGFVSQPSVFVCVCVCEAAHDLRVNKESRLFRCRIIKSADSARCPQVECLSGRSLSVPFQ